MNDRHRTAQAGPAVGPAFAAAVVSAPNAIVKDWRRRAFAWVLPVVMAVFFHQAWSAADWMVGGPYAFSGLLLCLALVCVWGRSLPQRRVLTQPQICWY